MNINTIILIIFFIQTKCQTTTLFDINSIVVILGFIISIYLRGKDKPEGALFYLIKELGSLLCVFFILQNISSIFLEKDLSLSTQLFFGGKIIFFSILLYILIAKFTTKQEKILNQIESSEKDLQLIDDFIYELEDSIKELEKQRYKQLLFPYFKEIYRKNFKEFIINNILQKLSKEHFKYEFDEFINRQDFNQSNLFTELKGLNNDDYSINIGDLNWEYKGGDLIKGKVNNLNFECSELHIKKGSGDDESCVFDGLFFVIEIPQRVQIPFGTNSTFGNKILLDNPEFNELFSVFAEDESEAFYILSSKVLEKMVNYVYKTGHNFDFSFIQNKLYIAIETGTMKQFFEPPIFKSLWDYKVYDEIIMDFKLIFKLLNTLEFKKVS